MIRKLTIILAFLTLSAPAMAQSMCNERGSFVKHLSSKYAEAPVAMGLSAEGSVLEVRAPWLRRTARARAGTGRRPLLARQPAHSAGAYCRPTSDPVATSEDRG